LSGRVSFATERTGGEIGEQVEHLSIVHLSGQALLRPAPGRQTPPEHGELILHLVVHG